MSLCPDLTKRGHVPTGPGSFSGEPVDGALQLCAAWTQQSHGHALGLHNVAVVEQRVRVVDQSEWGPARTVWWNVSEESVSVVGSGRALGGSEYGTLCDVQEGGAEECPPMVLYVGCGG